MTTTIFVVYFFLYRWVQLGATANISFDPTLVQPQSPSVMEWTSLGDSYASGIGSGSQYGYNRCFRCSLSYPTQMQNGFISGPPERYNNVSCSGDTSDLILQWQFLDQPKFRSVTYGTAPAWGGKPAFSTLSFGGNDIGILALLTTCIYEVNFRSKPDCDQVLNNSLAIIQSQLFRDNLNKVMSTALNKGRQASGPDFRVFVQGYPQFFNAETDQCNNISFRVSFRTPILLTREQRVKYNNIAIRLNAAIQTAVVALGTPNVIFIDVDHLFRGHRWCEPGVIEPDPDNPNTWIFNSGLIRPDENVDPRLRQVYDLAFPNSTNNILYKDTQINDALWSAIQQIAPSDPNIGQDILKPGHPKPAGHKAIANAIINTGHIPTAVVASFRRAVH
ncbi:MAG: hypothetical protein M1814_002764 [Vezdaea aestivalis]|nr:MAG: hypothetical protein M1814_002764 [Vezdaea aestivalis]